MFAVLSYDPQKVWVDQKAGMVVVRKRTIPHEYEGILQAHQYLTRYPVSLLVNGSIYSVKPVPLVSWENEKSLLTTLFCDGENLEHILRKTSLAERSSWLIFCKDLFSKMRSIGFLWGDCAPRNIVIQEKKRLVRIMDFEREQCFLSTSVDESSFRRFVRNYAYEEFSSFLFKSEQKKVFSESLKGETMEHIHLTKITSMRRRRILEKQFGRKEAYAGREVEDVEDIMVFAATPFMLDGVVYFPMDFLEKIGRNGGLDAYTRVVEKIRKLADTKDRFRELTKARATLR